MAKRLHGTFLWHAQGRATTTEPTQVYRTAPRSHCPDRTLLQPQTPALGAEQPESGSLRCQPPAAHAATQEKRQGAAEKRSLTRHD